MATGANESNACGVQSEQSGDEDHEGEGNPNRGQGGEQPSAEKNRDLGSRQKQRGARGKKTGETSARSRGGASVDPKWEDSEEEWSATLVIVPHKFPGVYFAAGLINELITENPYPESNVNEEVAVTIEKHSGIIRYQSWDTKKSELAAAIVSDLDSLYITPRSTVLYLGCSFGKTLPHISNIIGVEGVVYIIQPYKQCHEKLKKMAKGRPNMHPIEKDPRRPGKYRKSLKVVDCIFADFSQPDQACAVAHNAKHFLKNGGHFIVSVKARFVDPSVEPDVVYARERMKLRGYGLMTSHTIKLDSFIDNHALILGVYRAARKRSQRHN